MLEVKFIPGSEIVSLVCSPPQPAKKFIPQWFKNVPSPYNLTPEFNSMGQITNKNVKLCMPFVDSLTSGYILSAWCDIYIKRENGAISYFYSEGPEVMKVREKSHVEVNSSYEPLEFVWKLHWGFRLPKGYSMLVTHPFNRYDLPFITLTGIMDSDNFDIVTNVGGNVAFFLQKDFEGIIPAGTPLMQLLPIKRGKWQSMKEDFDPKLNAIKTFEFGKKFMGYYKNNYWNKKEYN
jgi:hypothetical protein